MLNFFKNIFGDPLFLMLISREVYTAQRQAYDFRKACEKIQRDILG